MNLHMNTAPAEARDEYIIGRKAAWFAFAMTMALMLFDYIDRQVIVSLFPYLKAEWDLSDKQLGLLVSIVSITTGPDVVPLLTRVPRGCRLSSDAISVSLPTES